MLHTLHNRRGETLVETLVALLISAISLIMFAQMLSPAVNLTKTGRSWNAAVNELNTLLETRSGGGIRTVSGAISISSGGATLIEDNTPVILYIADADKYSGEQVISYGTETP
ncbi:MAG: prepilin-type N-terminal cleavage/methylation domain-containing protein [Oscillospiraceae bacterium]|nr:prepilin-type N-terminal cleavage/methylation domain-containing protein [Oscillospiraceae bacterium]